MQKSQLVFIEEIQLYIEFKIRDIGCGIMTNFESLQEFRDAIKINDDNWDDYGYKCAIKIICGNIEYRVRVGPESCKKEMRDYMEEGRIKPENELLSCLGGLDYYKFLTECLPYDIRKEWFELTNDLAFDIQKLESLAKELDKYASDDGRYKYPINPMGTAHNFFYTSFLRTTTLKEIKDVFHPLTILGRPEDQSDPNLNIKESFDERKDSIIYSFTDDTGDKGEIKFEKNRESYLPMNVYGIVGGNGSGNSYKINKIIQSHLEGDNKFSQIIHFSLSPFDNTIKYTDANLRNEFKGEIKDENGDILYEKVGIASIDNRWLRAIQTKIENLTEIKSYINERYGVVSGEDTIPYLEVKDCFTIYIQNILLDLIASIEKMKLWEDSLQYFEFEEWALNVREAFSDRSVNLEVFKSIDNLSSGQATILLYLTKLVSSVNKGSLIIFDEPETFMHPPMMKAFIQSVSKIVKKVGAFCLVATHSPIIIQEIPHCNVYNINSEHKIENICYKTYGQNLDTLYKNIYGVELQQTGYCALLSERKNIEGMTRENLLKKMM